MKRRRFINAIDYAGHLREVCIRFEHQPTPEQVEAAWQCRVRFTRACLAPRPGALEMLAALRGQGYRVGLISDCSWEVLQLWPDTPFAPLFDSAVFSCDVGAVKPDPSIYLHACRLLRVEPSACLYFGDGNSHELTGAQQVGMTPVMFYMPYERELIMRRPGVAEWRGPVVTRMEDVRALAVGYRAVE